MQRLLSPFKITIYPNVSYMKNGQTIHIDSNMSMEKFLAICSSKLKIRAKRAFTINGEEITDIVYITQDDHIYITEGEELQSPIIESHYKHSHKKSFDSDFRVNLIILGPAGVGKSSIIIRYIHQKFSDVYIPTVEALFHKVEKVDNDTYDLTILDTSGTEEWATLQYEYINNRDAVILAYSIERRENLEAIEKIYQEIRHYKQDIHIALVANKIDKAKRLITKEEGEALAQKFQCKYYEVSAKKNINITELFFDVIRMVSSEKRKESLANTHYNTSIIDEDMMMTTSKELPKKSTTTNWASWILDKCSLI